MPVSPKEVLKWSPAQWKSNVKHARPSGGGAVGVMFCWTRNPSSEGPDYRDVSSADFVIKPMAGSAAPARFAEKLLKDAIGAKGIGTQALNRGTPGFDAARDTLNAFQVRIIASAVADGKSSMEATIVGGTNWRNAKVAIKSWLYQASDSVKKDSARWKSVWPHYDSAGSYLIQETASSVREFGDEYHAGKLDDLLKDEQLMTNLGRLFAADAVLGNGDRMSFVNTGNIMYDGNSRTVVTIDSQAILCGFNELVAKGILGASNSGDLLAQQFANAIVLPNDPGGGSLTGPAASFAMQHLANPQRWWKVVFKDHFRSSYDRDSGLQKFAFPDDQAWADAYTWFEIGLQDGLRIVDSRLSGLNWLGVKNCFGNYVKRYGADLNMDWTNLKVRRLYVKTVLAESKRLGGLGGTNAAAIQDAAFKAVSAYTARKFG